MKKKVKCFWCNKKFVDLIKHTKNKHPKLTPRSYEDLDMDEESFMKLVRK